MANDAGLFSGILSPEMVEKQLDAEIMKGGEVSGQQGAALLGGMLGKWLGGGGYQNDPRMVEAVKIKGIQDKVASIVQDQGIDPTDMEAYGKVVAAVSMAAGMPQLAERAGAMVQQAVGEKANIAYKESMGRASEANAASLADLREAQSKWATERGQLYEQLNEFKREHWKNQDEAALLRAQLAGVKSATAKADLAQMSQKNIDKLLKADEDLKGMSKSDRESMSVAIALRSRQLYGKDNMTDVNEIIDQAIQETKDKGFKPGKTGWLGGMVPFTGTEPSYSSTTAARNTVPPAPSAKPVIKGKMRVISPDGQAGSIDAKDWEAYKKRGFKQE